MKTGFLYLLVGQLCTNPKSDRSLLSCFRVTQCSTSEIEDAPLYKLMVSTDPSYNNRTLASTLKMQIWIATNNRDVPMVMKTKFLSAVMVFGVDSSEGHFMPPHFFEVGLKVNTEVYLDVLKSVVIAWCNQVADGRPWVWQQDSAQVERDPGLASERVLRLCTLISLLLSSLDLNLLEYFVWSSVENITNMTSHNTKASLIAAIRRVFAGLPPALVKKACGDWG